MLEAFELKRANHELRQELTHALYQHDAACRVIARLTKERDQARQALAALSAAAPAAAVSAAGAPDSGTAAMEDVQSVSALPDEVVTAITDTAKTLAKVRAKGLGQKTEGREREKTFKALHAEEPEISRESCITF